MDVLDLLASGLSREQVLEELPDLESEDISAALQYASRRLSHPLPESSDSGLKLQQELLRQGQHRWDENLCVSALQACKRFYGLVTGPSRTRQKMFRTYGPTERRRERESHGYVFEALAVLSRSE